MQSLIEHDVTSLYFLSLFKDWYPRYLEVHKDNKDIAVTFNLAPKDLEINRYLLSCYGGGSRSFEIIQPVIILIPDHSFLMNTLKKFKHFCLQHKIILCIL